MYATWNIITFISYFASFCSWGRLVCGDKGKAGWMPAVGIACCSIVATLGFECGLPVTASGVLIFTVAWVHALFWLLRRHRSPGAPSAATLGICVAVALLLVAPMAIGGPQFSLFQRNIYDQFNYLACAVVRTTETHRSIAAAIQPDFLRNSLLPIAHTMEGARPAVVDLYATLEGLVAGNLYRCHYGFLCAFAMGSFLAVAEGLRSLCGAASWRAHLAAAAYVTGFWGQLQLDLNAWSWAAATPLTAAAIGMIIDMHPFSASAERQAVDRRGALALGICVAGQIYLYPEMFAFLAPAVLSILVVLVYVDPARRHSAAGFLLAAAAAVLLTLPQLGAILRFTVHQVTFSSKANFSPLDWMWQMVVGGPLSGAGLAESASRWFAGSLGLGWLLWATGTRWATFALSIAVVACTWTCLGRLRPFRRQATFAALVLGVLAAQIAACVALGYPWIAAKGVSYVSVLALPVFLAPAATGRVEWARVPSWALLCLQLTLGLLRPAAAGGPDGTRRWFPNYPENMDPVLKADRSWDVGEGPRLLAASRCATIDVPDLWLETYAAICVQSQGLRFFKTLPVYIYPGISEDSYGRMAPQGDFDAIVYLNYDRNRRHTGLGFARRDGAVYGVRSGPRIVRIQAVSGLDTLNGLLAWRMQISAGQAGARITMVDADSRPMALELGVVAPTSVRGNLALTIETKEGTHASFAVAGYGDKTIQGLRVPLKVAPGSGEISLSLSAADGNGPNAPPIELVNPQLVFDGTPSR
jgi:hypothetical protein